jgi:uncharacterized protein (UPF0332 family)
MTLSEFEDCIKKGLLRKVAPSKDNAAKSIERAKMWLSQAKEAFDAEIYDASILASYEAMFHAARSLLIKDGYREKSHYCISRYLEQVYSEKGLFDKNWVIILDSYREMRHRVAYNTEFEATDSEAKEAIKDSEMFIEEMAKHIK